MFTKHRSYLSNALLISMLGLSLTACQFQPLYSNADGSLSTQNSTLSNLSVAEVETRQGQQVRNHLIFLLAGGANPINPTHDVRLRVSTASTDLAAKISGNGSTQLGNTAGQVRITASYEIYDTREKTVVYRGTRSAAASFDETSQQFAAARAERDAENRAAREVAEQLRLAIAADFNRI